MEKPVSRLVLGSVPFESMDRALAYRMLDAFFQIGGNAVDTARHYGDTVEGAIGEWMRERDNRSDMVIVGKGGHPDRTGPRVNEAAIAADVQRSLELLRTDYIDLFLLHRDDPSVPVADIIEWLNNLMRAGQIRAFGGSNWAPARLEAGNRYARAHGLAPLVAGSPQLSLAVPQWFPWGGCLAVSPADRDWYAREQFPLVAWAAQAQGFFTGETRGDVVPTAEFIRTWHSRENFERLERARDLAGRLRVSPTAVALAWVLQQPFPTFAIIGPRTVEELASSADALRVTLSPDDLRWLNLENDRLG